MARFEWKADYATGNALIDAQHQQLIEFANLLIEAAETGKEGAILEQSFDMLFHYTHDLFRDEENLYVSEQATRMALEAIQCLGANGYLNDFIAGRLLRDAKLYEIGAGTNEIRRMLVGRELFKETAD